MSEAQANRPPNVVQGKPGEREIVQIAREIESGAITLRPVNVNKITRWDEYLNLVTPDGQQAGSGKETSASYSDETRGTTHPDNSGQGDT